MRPDSPVSQVGKTTQRRPSVRHSLLFCRRLFASFVPSSSFFSVEKNGRHSCSTDRPTEREDPKASPYSLGRVRKGDPVFMGCFVRRGPAAAAAGGGDFSVLACPPPPLRCGALYRHGEEEERGTHNGERRKRGAVGKLFRAKEEKPSSLSIHGRSGPSLYFYLRRSRQVI